MASSFLEQKAWEQAEKLEKQYGSSAYGGTTWLNEQINGKKKKKKKDDDIAPVRTTTTKQDDRKWFEKGAFEDGYQFGDVFKTILGTGQDVHENLFEGVYGIAEKAIDAGAYLVGGAAGLMGADKFRDKTEAFIEKDLIDEERWAKFATGTTTLTGIATKLLSGGKDTDDMSVLGEKSDALVQSGGQLAATIGLQSVGVPWWVTSGVTSFGGETENALKEGATYGKAGLSAAITTGAEILSEKLFGGSGLGEIGLINVEALTRGIASKGLKLALDYGIDVVGEGFEEGFSQFFSNLGTALYKEENLKDILFSEEALDGYLESAIGGGLLGGVMNVGNVRHSAKTGRDYRSGLTTNEQKVIDKEIENRIAEQEKDGKKLTNKEKAKIYDQVIEDMAEGDISIDTIESVLAGEEFQPYKEMIDEETAIREELEGYQTEYENLSKKDTLTLEETVRKNELAKLYTDAKAKLDDADRIGKRDYLKANLDKEVYEMTKGSKLTESFYENVRAQQKFEADVTKYEGKGKALIQSAIDSDALDNTRKMHKFIDTLANIANDSGRDITVAKQDKLLDILEQQAKDEGRAFDRSRFDGKIIDGVRTQNGIILNPESKRALNFVAGHEITHTLEKSGHYKGLFDALMSYGAEEYQKRFDERAKQYEGIYADENYKDVIDMEVAADMVGDYLFTDYDFVSHLSAKHQNVFQKVWSEIKHLCKLATAGSKEARELEKVKRAFEQAYKEGGKAQTETKYQLSSNAKTELHKALYDTNYRSEVLLRDVSPSIMVSQKGVKNLPMAMNASHIRENVFTEDEAKQLGLRVDDDTHYHGLGEDFFLKIIDGLDNVKVAYRGTRNASNPARGENYFLLVSEFKDDARNTINVPVYIDEHAQVNRVFVDVNKISTVFGRDAFDEYIKRQVQNGDLVRIKNRDIETSERSALIAEGYGKDVSEESVPQQEKTVKADSEHRSYSLSDSDGKQLTKEQQDYFKDSKERDENGNLRVMYRGDAGDIAVFDRKKSSYSNLYGRGFYFTNSESHAGQYGKPTAYYLNVTSPVSTIERTITKEQMRSFLEAVAENEDYGLENYGYGATVDSVLDSVYSGKSDFAMLYDVSQTAIGDMVSATELFNEVNGTNYDGFILDTETVVFNSNQIKRTDNTKPTSDPDVRFSLSEPVEQTKDLVAVHNLHTAELLETLKLSGLPSPSVAIIKAKDGHDKYGDVSLILPKDAIDPQANKANKIYGSDAWTPTRSNAQVEYEVDYEKQRQFERTVEQLSKNIANGVFSKSSVLGMAGIEDSTNLNLNEIARKLSDYEAVQAAYVAENGGNVEVAYRAKEFDTYGNKALKSYIDKVGEQEVARLTAKLMTGERLTAEELETAKDAIVDDWTEKREYALKQKPELREARIAVFRERLNTIRVEDFVRHAWEFYEDSGATTDEIDHSATSNNLRAAVNRADVEAWVAEKLQGLLSEPGIYNGKDFYTSSGKRRSFGETHWEYTAENIVRAMNNADARGANMWGISGEAIIATATPEYQNIDEVRADKNRLFKATDDDYEQIKDAISEELETITKDIIRTNEHQADNQYDEEQIVGRVIMEAAQGTRTVSGVIHTFQKNGYGISEAQARFVLSLFDHASSVPTEYFEAKPQRVVGFEEVGVYVIPNNADVKLKQELLNRGYSIAEYDPNIEGHRQQVVNQFEEYKFSLSNVGEQFVPYGNWNVYNRYSTHGKDIRLEVAPVREDVAPVSETNNAPPVGGETDVTKRKSALKSGIEYYQSIIRGEEVNTFDISEDVLASAISKMEELLSNEDGLQSMTSEDFDAFMRRMGLYSWNREAKIEKTVDAPIKTTKERLETKLSNRQTELSNIEKLRADSNKSYDEKIAKAQAELDSKKNKDSKVANNLRKRIERLQRLKADIDAGYAKRINDINKSIDKTSAELEKDHTEKDRYAKAVNRINAVLEHDKAELQAEYAKRKADMESRTADKNSYTSQMAKELYDEIRNLKKGVRASDALASLLDAGYDWGNIRSALTNVHYNPAETVNPNSDTEAAVRQLINESYEEDVYSIDDLDVELAEEINKLDTKAEEDRKKARTATQRRVKSEEYNKLWKYLIGDTSTWKDMPLGLSYKTKTLRRILRKVVKDANGNPDYHKADIIYDELEVKYDHNEALLKRESQNLKEVFQKLNLNHAEDTYAHMLGELRYNSDTELTEDAVNEYYEKHKHKIDTKKVDKAITEARKVFDDLILRVNEVLKEQGFKEIPYRKGYFPHFTNPKQGLLAKLLNWKPVNTEIPTSIAGLTETFKPQRSYQSFDKQRHGDTTDYSLYQGLDTYIHGALDWIYHIEDIQKRRALENYLRTIHSDEGITQRIQEIKDGNYDADEAQQMIDAVLSEANNPLSGLVRELMNRTNTLANKKAAADRAMEDDTNRKVYSTMTNLNNRITSNMVVGSISSALTNFIPLVQSWHQVSPVYTVRGLGDFVRSAVRDDGMVERSDFLTNRLMEEENLYKTGWDKVSDKAAFMMNAFDKITSHTVWRSKYLQNIHEGMSEAMAIKDADQFAKNLMAGRSRGNAPTIFDAKNPITKLFTAFQLEVANQYGYMFDDVIKDSTSKARLVKGYATAFVGAYVYNAIFSALVGRDAAFDPIGIIQDLLGDLLDDEEEPEDIILNFTENILQEVPYVGGLLGGGRVPISSALPYSNVSNPFESMLNDLSEGNLDNVGKELLKPLYYLAMPVGGGQLKKTVEGLSMFSDDHPIAGSYTKSGDLRFPVDDTIGNKVKAALFGQYASENARDYFDNGYAPLKEKQIQEFIDVDIPIRDYWEYREGLSGLSKLEEKADYIAGLDLPIDKKNLLINNLSDRKEDIDLEGYEDFDGFEEFDFAMNNPEKYEVAKKVGGYEAYMEYREGMKGMKLAEKADYISGLDLTDAQKNALINGETDRKEPIDMTGYNTSDYSSFEEFEFSKEYPEKYAVAKAVGGYEAYTNYSSELYDIKADKDKYGKSISGSRKAKVLDYINNLDADYYTRIILWKSEYPSDDSYNSEIIDYVNSRDDLSYAERIAILRKLGFDVTDDGDISW